MIWAFESDVIYMEEKMNKLCRIIHKKPVVLLLVLVVLFVTVATVYGVLPTISLNSPTSFPVDI
jgi:hypothetical protein